MLKKIRRVIVTLVILGLVGAAIYAVMLRIKDANQKEALVVPVRSISDSYYMPSTTLEGSLTTNVSQSISFSKDVIVDEVLVEEGDLVEVGDKLLSFDMTLVEMELNIARLKRIKQEIDLETAVNRLYSLQNGGPIEASTSETTSSYSSASGYDTASSGNGLFSLGFAPLMALPSRPLLLLMGGDLDFEIDLLDSGPPAVGIEMGQDADPETWADAYPSYDTGGEALPQETAGGAYSSYEGDLLSDGGEDLSGTPNWIQEQTIIGDSQISYQIPEEEELSSGGVYLFPGQSEGTPSLINPLDIGDGNDHCYQTLDGRSEAFSGRGTREDPLVFLVSSAKGRINVKGAFFNRMAGYSEDGGTLIHPGGYWYLLEFHKRDTITDYHDRKASCTGYFFINGGYLENPVNMFAEIELSQDDALEYRVEEPASPDDGSGGGSYDGGSSTSMTREEAIKMAQMQIASLRLDIQESEIKISKLSRQVQQKEIFAKMEGVVTHVGDPLTAGGSGNAFMRIKSREGYFLKGNVSELLLDKVTVGTKLKCYGYQSGNFEAEVIEVSEYPVEGYSYWDGNPNVSYYSFTASLGSQQITYSEYDYISVTLDEDASMRDNAIVLQRAFVRAEDGGYYVYKDDNGVLKKQPVSVGGIANSGYSLVVTGGITKDDRIAFPYGSLAAEGVKTREGTMDELYGY